AFDQADVPDVKGTHRGDEADDVACFFGATDRVANIGDSFHNLRTEGGGRHLRFPLERGMSQRSIRQNRVALHSLADIRLVLTGANQDKDHWNPYLGFLTSKSMSPSETFVSILL